MKTYGAVYETYYLHLLIFSKLEFDEWRESELLLKYY